MKLTKDNSDFICKFLESLGIEDGKDKLEEFQKKYAVDHRCSATTSKGTGCRSKKIIGECFCTLHKRINEKKAEKEPTTTETVIESDESTETVIESDEKKPLSAETVVESDEE